MTSNDHLNFHEILTKKKNNTRNIIGVLKKTLNNNYKFIK
jgi:hypothetical protein